MKLRIWTILAAFIIVATFGLALPTVLTNNEASVAVNYQKVKDDFKSEMIQSLAALNYAEPGTPSGEGVTTPDATSDKASIPTTSKTSVAPGAAASDSSSGSTSGSASDSASGSASDVATVEVTNGSVPLGGTEAFVKDGWINQKINENKDKISTNDLDRGASIYNGLDTDYLFTLADGGLTDEERAQVDAYLSKTLSGGDYALAKELYYKYVGLLSND